jgi:hypothetical protein
MIQVLHPRAALPRNVPSPSPIEYRIATTKWERLAAYRLVYDHYRKAGFIQSNPFRFRVTKHHLLPTTQVFLAVRDEEPICTVSLVADTPMMGLPMESIYHEEVAQSRDKGLHVGEVSALAGCTTDFRSFLPIFVQLTRLMAQYARQRGMHQFLIAVHPKHAGFYERFMGFEKIGPVREYPCVQNAPAVACCLDFERIDRDRPKCWYDFFGAPLPESRLETVPMEEDELSDYEPIADFYETGVLGNAFAERRPRESSALVSCGR